MLTGHMSPMLPAAGGPHMRFEAPATPSEPGGIRFCRSAGTEPGHLAHQRGDQPRPGAPSGAPAAGLPVHEVPWWPRRPGTGPAVSRARAGPMPNGASSPAAVLGDSRWRRPGVPVLRAPPRSAASSAGRRSRAARRRRTAPSPRPAARGWCSPCSRATSRRAMPRGQAPRALARRGDRVQGPAAPSPLLSLVGAAPGAPGAAAGKRSLASASLPEPADPGHGVHGAREVRRGTAR